MDTSFVISWRTVRGALNKSIRSVPLGKIGHSYQLNAVGYLRYCVVAFKGTPQHRRGGRNCKAGLMIFWSRLHLCTWKTKIVRSALNND